MGLFFILANIWVTANRSLAMRSMEGVVTGMDRRLEKHPGEDDVFLLAWDGGPMVQVDSTLFERLHLGAIVGKEAWSMSIRVDGRQQELSLSRDFWGMLALALPAVIVLLYYARWVRIHWVQAEVPQG
jgi:hypothetical protein